MSLLEDHDLVKTHLKDLLLRNNSAKSTDIKRRFSVFKTSLSTCDQLSFLSFFLFSRFAFFVERFKGMVSELSAQGP